MYNNEVGYFSWCRFIWAVVNDFTDKINIKALARNVSIVYAAAAVE